eukprot:TRINITY_DN1737_c0_g1_i1.p1 TRINITY_DN1737_c0_g1~~TRINITY_DN1737_c0_g1_i1.p1  ORF type:complete len:488 (+),score=59.23 TRINITY_DN1737_c0_g1_i1:57-1466(+)
MDLKQGKVLYVRSLPTGASEAEIATLGQPFGTVVRVLKLPGKDHQAFIEFDTAQAGQTCVAYYQSTPAQVRNRTVEVKFSPHESLAAAPSVPDGGAGPVLLVTINQPSHPVDCDTLAHIFSQYGGTVRRLVMFEKNNRPQCLIEFNNPTEALVAKSVLDGHNIYQDGCVMSIQHSILSELHVSENGKNSRDYTALSPQLATHQAHLLAQQQLLPGMFGFPSIPTQPSALAMGMVNSGPTRLSPVLHISNLNELQATPFAIFKLFGTYGDVFRVKILYKNRSQALVLFRDADQAGTALRFLNGISMYGRQLKVARSRNFEIPMPTPDTAQEVAALTQDFSDTPLHRFKIPGSKNFQHITPPSPALHLSNIPQGYTSQQLVALLSQFGELRFFEFFSTPTMAVALMDSVDSAVSALIGLHGEALAGSPNRLNVSFSAKRVMHGTTETTQQVTGVISQTLQYPTTAVLSPTN